MNPHPYRVLWSRTIFRSLLTVLLCVVVGPVIDAVGAEKSIRFSRDIRPVLSNACYSCHGTDDAARKSGLRLDQREGALKPADSGDWAIVPHDADSSELLRRINSTDPAEMMPPPSSNKTLTSAERERLKQWIVEGAEYESHWSFVEPKRSPLPALSSTGIAWANNEIDFFVFQQLQAEGMQPATIADRSTRLRRLSFDLTGLPPTLSETERFLNDTSPDAYDRLVDRLLGSEAFGERFAALWLDLARYADTNGYNNDEDRTMWLWREWVIDAFNSNMPFDQFVTEQIAGDLLPNSTPEQKLATGFNRNHVITTEGGIFPEEYRVEYVADRVHTTATVFLGLSFQCARCHDHKYDPFSQADYYRLFAYFNNVQDKTVGYNSGAPAEPYLKVMPRRWMGDHQRLVADLDSARRSLKESEEHAVQAVADWENSLSAEFREKLSSQGASRFDFDEADAGPPTDLVNASRQLEFTGNVKRANGKSGQAIELDGTGFGSNADLADLERDQPMSLGAWVFPSARETFAIASRMDQADASRGFDLLYEAGHVVVHLIHKWPENAIKVKAKTPFNHKEWHFVMMTYDGSSRAAGVQIFVDGKRQEQEVLSDSLTDTIRTTQPFRVGQRTTTLGFKGRIDDVQLYSSVLQPAAIEALAAGNGTDLFLASVLQTPVTERNSTQQRYIVRHYLTAVDSQHVAKQDRVAASERALAQLETAVPATMVMQELETPRQAFILRRGQYDQPGEPVSAGVPGSLPPLPMGVPNNRLGLAQWLVERRNPLTARVAVNRFWQLLFGTGIVETVEDFGLQGAFPTHPELLDWLAVDFQESGWDVKRLIRRMVLSATYQQASMATVEQLQKDPANRWLGRGTRMRLPAEMLRDNALGLSGLLTHRIGGPSVKPYQPAGIWQDVSVERRANYETAKGADLYRRSLYTFWKRTCPPPGMTSFDAPDRETCTIRRARTNTPLQALVLLNDPTYIEAARNLAEQLLTLAADDSQADPADPTSAENLQQLQFKRAWLMVTARAPSTADAEALRQIVSRARARFAADPASADRLLAVGDSARRASIPNVEHAAWTTAFAVLLNSDEAMTRE